MTHYFKYEIKNSLGNFFAIFFGIVFPPMMTLLFLSIFGDSQPQASASIHASLFFTNILMSPLALIFVGFSALFAQEVEKDVTTRMVLFGYDEKKQLISKFVAQLFMLLISTIIYGVIVIPQMQLQAPTMFGLVVFLLSYVLLSITFFVLAYSIALLAKKFSITYGITMSFYFASMILSGMMGVQYEMLPKVMQYIARLLPTMHLAKDMPEIWTSTSYNLMPMIQSFMFFIAVTGIVTFIALRKVKRT